MVKMDPDVHKFPKELNVQVKSDDTASHLTWILLSSKVPGFALIKLTI